MLDLPVFFGWCLQIKATKPPELSPNRWFRIREFHPPNLNSGVGILNNLPRKFMLWVKLLPCFFFGFTRCWFQLTCFMFTPKKLGKIFNLMSICFFKLGCFKTTNQFQPWNFPAYARSGVFSDSASLDGEPARLGEAQAVCAVWVGGTYRTWNEQWKKGPWLFRLYRGWYYIYYPCYSVI